MSSFGDYSAKVIGSLAKTRRDHRWRSQLKEILSKTEAQVTPISSEREKEIRDYYARFGFRNIKTDWHQYIYNVIGEYSPLMIPEDFFHSVLERIYNVRGFTAWEDKAFMPFILPDIKFPETICCFINGYFYDANRKMISKEEAKKRIMDNDVAFAKPTLASGGG